MKITIISDTHGLHRHLNLESYSGDILIHAGDVLNNGFEEYLLEDFLMWMDALRYKHKIFIAGNHDKMFQYDSWSARRIYAKFPFITYLQDESITIDGIKIYGLPWTLRFHNWAFGVDIDSNKYFEILSKIDPDVDILISHGPPYDILDKSANNNQILGCYRLLDKINEINPKIHAFGHIHNSYGYINKNNIHFINASVLNDDYKVVNKPIHFDLDYDNNMINFLHL